MDSLFFEDDDDKIIYFDRGRGYLSRMVLGRKAEPTSKVFIMIIKLPESEGPD